MEKILHVDLTKLSIEEIFYIKQAYQIDFNLYYNNLKNQLDKPEIVRSLNQRREDYIKKISDLGEKNQINNDKFIIVVDNRLLGYCKYKIENSHIDVDTIYGVDERIIKILIMELDKKGSYSLNSTICNLNLDKIVKNNLKKINIEDFVNNPELLNNLTKDQLIEVLRSIKDQQYNKHDVDEYKLDSSVTDSIGENSSYNQTDSNENKKEIGIQKKLSNGHSIISDDKLKQGFVDALVLALLSGFISGVIITLAVVFIKIKSGI